MPSRAVAMKGEWGGGWDRKAEEPIVGTTGDDNNAARRPSGSRAGWRSMGHAPPQGPAAAGANPEGTGSESASPPGPRPEGADLVAGITGDITPEGAAALAAIAEGPGRALIALDFDGTLAP